eukprot:1148234-Pelagomonas_calceolata.AAC.10
MSIILSEPKNRSNMRLAVMQTAGHTWGCGSTHHDQHVARKTDYCTNHSCRGKTGAQTYVSPLTTTTIMKQKMSQRPVALHDHAQPSRKKRAQMFDLPHHDHHEAEDEPQIC